MRDYLTALTLFDLLKLDFEMCILMPFGFSSVKCAAAKFGVAVKMIFQTLRRLFIFRQHRCWHFQHFSGMKRKKKRRRRIALNKLHFLKTRICEFKSFDFRFSLHSCRMPSSCAGFVCYKTLHPCQKVTQNDIPAGGTSLSQAQLRHLN